jgi:hypothetical protein
MNFSEDIHETFFCCLEPSVGSENLEAGAEKALNVRVGVALTVPNAL